MSNAQWIWGIFLICVSACVGNPVPVPIVLDLEQDYGDDPFSDMEYDLSRVSDLPQPVRSAKRELEDEIGLDRTSDVYREFRFRIEEDSWDDDDVFYRVYWVVGDRSLKWAYATFTEEGRVRSLGESSHIDPKGRL